MQLDRAKSVTKTRREQADRLQAKMHPHDAIGPSPSQMSLGRASDAHVMHGSVEC